jgi:xylan 1,4-beta-xylosidase
MVWHYHDDDIAGPPAEVALQVAGLPAGAKAARLTHHRVDEFHSNPYGAWLRMGSPSPVNKQQYLQLLAASELATLEGAPATVAITGGTAELRFALPRQGVSLITLEAGE